MIGSNNHYRPPLNNNTQTSTLSSLYSSNLDWVVTALPSRGGRGARWRRTRVVTFITWSQSFEWVDNWGVRTELKHTDGRVSRSCSVQYFNWTRPASYRQSVLVCIWTFSGRDWSAAVLVMSLGMWCHTISWAGWGVKYETLLPPGHSLTNEDQHKSRSNKTVKTRNKSSKPQDFLHISLAELHPRPNGLWLDISSTGATTLSLLPSLSRHTEFRARVSVRKF